jgi:hypothetical protein
VIAAIVVGNVLYVLGAVAGIVVGAVVVSLRHRRPTSVEASVASFRRGLEALAPRPVTPDAPIAARHEDASGGAGRSGGCLPTEAEAV